MNAPAVSGKLWNKVFIMTMLVSALSNISNSMLSPALPIYVESLGRGTDIAGTIVAVATFLSMFGRGLSGGWSDKISRKTIILASLFFSTVAFVLFCFADNLPMLYLAKCMQGVSSGIITTVLCTIAYDTLPPELLGSGIGLFSLAGSLAQCLAPSIGTALASRGMYTLLFLSSAVASAASFLVLMFIPVQLTPKALAWKQAKLDGTAVRRGFRIGDYICREALPAAVLLLMNGIIHSAIMNYLSICGISRGIDTIAIFFTINSIVLIFARPVCGKLSDHKSMSWLMVPGYLCMGLACLIVAISYSVVPILIAAVFYGLGFGAVMCGAQLLAIRSAGPERRSIANSTYFVGGDVGLALGAYVSGALAAAVGYGPMYGIIAACCGLTLVGWVLYAARNKQNKALHPEL